jgi:hypothetical protein
MKKLILVVSAIWIITGCETEQLPVKVDYVITNAYSETEIKYQDENGTLHTETVEFESIEDRWKYSFPGEKGNIVYISTRYYDSTSSVNVQILLDGKIYKEKYSEKEPGQYITISGSIPY